VCFSFLEESSLRLELTTQAFEFSRVLLAFRFELLRLGDDALAQFETVALAHVEVFLDPRVFAVPVGNTLTESLKFGVFNTEVVLDGVNDQILRTDASRAKNGEADRAAGRRAGWMSEGMNRRREKRLNEKTEREGVYIKQDFPEKSTAVDP